MERSENMIVLKDQINLKKFCNLTNGKTNSKNNHVNNYSNLNFIENEDLNEENFLKVYQKNYLRLQKFYINNKRVMMKYK